MLWSLVTLLLSKENFNSNAQHSLKDFQYWKVQRANSLSLTGGWSWLWRRVVVPVHQPMQLCGAVRQPDARASSSPQSGTNNTATGQSREGSAAYLWSPHFFVKALLSTALFLGWPTEALSQRILNDLKRARLSRACKIWLLARPLPPLSRH